MATHSSGLAWRTPWTEEPGRLQSMSFQKSQTWIRDWTTTTICELKQGSHSWEGKGWVRKREKKQRRPWRERGFKGIQRETSFVAQKVKNLPTMQETWVWASCWEDPLEKEVATLSSYFCLENPMVRGAWRATVHGVAKSWTLLND